jgi:hypothetical protein
VKRGALSYLKSFINTVVDHPRQLYGCVFHKYVQKYGKVFFNALDLLAGGSVLSKPISLYPDNVYYRRQLYDFRAPDFSLKNKGLMF